MYENHWIDSLLHVLQQHPAYSLAMCPDRELSQQLFVPRTMLSPPSHTGQDKVGSLGKPRAPMGGIGGPRCVTWGMFGSPCCPPL